MLKSKIEIREFAVNKATEILGSNAPIKDVVAKAKEIESYVMGEAELAEMQNENEVLEAIIETIGVLGKEYLLSLLKEVSVDQETCLHGFMDIK